MAEWDSPYGLMRTAISSTSRLAIITPQTGTYLPVSSQLLSAFPGNACPTRLYEPLGSCTHSPRSHVTDLNRRGEVSPGGSAVRQLRLCRRVYFGAVVKSGDSGKHAVVHRGDRGRYSILGHTEHDPGG